MTIKYQKNIGILMFYIYIYSINMSVYNYMYYINKVI